MRYSNKELNLIHKFMFDLDANQISELLVEHGHYKRKTKSVQKKIDDKNRELERKEMRRKYFENYAKNNPIKYRARTLWNSAYSRSKSKNLDFDLSIEWVESRLREGICSVTGLPFEIKQYSKNGHLDKLSPYAPSIDRIDSDKGYTMDNTQIVLNNYNKFKSDSRTEDSIIIARALVYRTKDLIVSK
jgi:hypothetical protein